MQTQNKSISNSLKDYGKAWDYPGLLKAQSFMIRSVHTFIVKCARGLSFLLYAIEPSRSQ